jgi:glycosidase
MKAFKTLDISIFFTLTIVLLSCAQEKKEYSITLPENDAIVGLASPVQLGSEKAYFLQSEYFVPTPPDGLDSPEGLKIRVKGDTVFLDGNIHSAISGITAYKDGFTYFIPVKKANEVKHRYSFSTSDPSINKVQLRGSFNAWNAESTNLKYENGKWEVDLLLAPGDYEYLLVVDGKEMLDPDNTIKKDNGMGGFNSILSIAKADANKIPTLQTRAYSETAIEVSSSLADIKLLALWNNVKMDSTGFHLHDQIIHLYIPKEAKELKRSYIRVWAYNSEGLSNDLFIPLAYGKPIVEADQLDRMDKHAMMMYFLLIDRFENGDSLNDFPVNDPAIHPKANYYGGDLQGVIDKINTNYFDSLGVNTIWLSPITLNPEGAYGLYPTPLTKFSGYHGYWPIRSTVVDYRYGTMEQIKELTNTAHKHQMNVLIDYVANHVHQEHPIYIEHPDWVTDLYLPDGSLNTERWDDHRLTTWFDTFLPTLDLSRAEVVEPMTDSALFWLKEVGIDGFRHDATKHIPEIFWETLTYKVKTQVQLPENREVFQIGETYGSKGLINSYIGSGKLDSQFDFNTYDDAVATFARKDIPFQRLQNGLEESFSIYGYHNLMGYITGNQDRTRFISYASGDVAFDEDPKLAGWTRDIIISDSAAYDRLEMLIAFTTTIPGIPVIYYGDEFGSPGANDPDNRRMMKFSSLDPKEAHLKEQVSQLFKIRKKYTALIYGDTEFLLTTEDQWAFKRTWFGENILVVFNKSDEKARFDIPINLSFTSDHRSLIKDNTIKEVTENNMNIELAPRSYEIIYFKS